MPIADPAPRRSAQERLRHAQERAELARLARRLRRPPERGDGGAADGVPVDPTPPGSRDGGAAAVPTFDD